MRKGQASNLGLILTVIVVVVVLLLIAVVGGGFFLLRMQMAGMAPTHLTGPPIPTVPLQVPKGEAQPPPPPASPVAIGKPAPEIQGEDIDGVPFKLSDYRGKIILLDFWGHW